MNKFEKHLENIFFTKNDALPKLMEPYWFKHCFCGNCFLEVKIYQLGDVNYKVEIGLFEIYIKTYDIYLSEFDANEFDERLESEIARLKSKVTSEIQRVQLTKLK